MDEKVVDALEFIEAKVKEYKSDEISVLSSFGKDSIALLHLVLQVAPKINVLWIVTPFKPPETIEYGNHMAKLWKMNLIKLYSEKVSDLDFMENIVVKPNLPKTNPELCCNVFKDEPLFTKVREMKLKAWFSGLRKSESEKRENFTREWRQGEFVKLHPILDFTEADIWRYLASHSIPVHPWYAEGYRSLGCAPCSAPNMWNAERGGRWKDTAMEGLGCGIHCIPPYADKDEWHRYFGRD